MKKAEKDIKRVLPPLVFYTPALTSFVTPGGMEHLLDQPDELGRLLRLLKELMKILETYGFWDFYLPVSGCFKESWHKGRAPKTVYMVSRTFSLTKNQRVESSES